jgi:hypothetical protein
MVPVKIDYEDCIIKLIFEKDKCRVQIVPKEIKKSLNLQRQLQHAHRYLKPFLDKIGFFEQCFHPLISALKNEDHSFSNFHLEWPCEINSGMFDTSGTEYYIFLDKVDNNSERLKYHIYNVIRLENFIKNETIKNSVIELLEQI